MGVRNSIVIAAALAGVMAAANAQAAEKKVESKTIMGECHGANSCKGTSDCHGAGNSCAGSNSCKGKGWKRMSQEDCKTQKGKFKSDDK